jgi:hypothetical protein
MDVGRRLKLGLLALVALIGATMALTTVAQARTVPDPMLSSVPYLAWRGEAVRLVKCAPASAFPAGYAPSAADAGFTLVDWSGDPHLASPELVTSAPGFDVAIFARRGFDGAYCWGTSFISQKAGFAIIKMTVRAGNGGPLLFVHDFLVGWMNLNSIVLCNNSAPGPCSGPTTEVVQDVAGAATPNILEANVTGNIPLLQDFNELGIGHPITQPDGTSVNGVVLPTDWLTLATSRLATVQGPLGDPTAFWDTHDDTAATEGHAQESPASICQPRVTTGIDAVDQCSDFIPPCATGCPTTGSLSLSNEVGGFSSIYTFTNAPGGSLSLTPTVGPFDQTRAGQTYLADGKIDAGDAPMPSARIDFTIAPNTGGATDISGVGSFSRVDKGLCPGQSALNDSAQPAGGEPGLDAADQGCTNSIYVRPGATTPHHLYAPFYREYLPATKAPADPFSSGIDGGFANNFNGFLNLSGNALADPSGLYDYWDIAEVLRSAVPAPTKCLLRAFPGSPLSAFRLLPGGPQSDVVYSDEHGEARIGFLPGTGFFFDNFGIQNANLGCDLAGIATLGTAAVTATARYPYEPVTAAPLTSNVVTKAVASRFLKLIQCFPKGPSAFDHQTAVCVAHAQDITGAAFASERVCFFSGGEGMFLPAISPITIPGQTTFPAIDILPAPSLAGPNNVCAFTDARGNTAVEVFESNAVSVNVGAFFVEEGLMRSVHVTFPITGPTAAVSGPVPGSATNTTGNSNTQVPIAGSSNPNGTPVTVDSSHVDSTVQVRYRITLAKLNGKVLKIRLSGPNGNANVAIGYLSNAKKVGTLVRSVPANKVVKLRLPLPKGVKKLRLSVMAG